MFLDPGVLHRDSFAKKKVVAILLQVEPALRCRAASESLDIRSITCGGVRPATIYGETEEFSSNIVRDLVHLHDRNAALLHCLSFDHKRLAI